MTALEQAVKLSREAREATVTMWQAHHRKDERQFEIAYSRAYSLLSEMDTGLYALHGHTHQAPPTPDNAERVATFRQSDGEPDPYLLGLSQQYATASHPAFEWPLFIDPAAPPTNCSPCPLTGYVEIPNCEPRCDDCPAAASA